MPVRIPDPGAKPATAEEVVHAIKVSPIAAVIGFVMFSLACFLTYSLFESRVPALERQVFLGITGVLLSVWLVLDGLILFRRPTTQELIRVWAPMAKGILIGTDVVVLASLWLFLPHADQPLILLMMLFYACHLSTQVLCSPENTEFNRIGIVAILGSAVVFLLLRGGDVETALAVFLAGYGIMMYFVSDVIRRSVRDAVAARMESEASARALEKAVAEVVQERDAKTRFIAAASHDLGQPLQAANLFFDQVVRARDDTTRDRAAAGARRAFDSAEQLLSHMLNHLRLEADAVRPHPSTVELARCFERVATIYLPMAQEQGIELRVARCRQKLHLDPALLDRAVGNFVANAIAHSGARRVLLGCKRAGAGRARIYVLDNGVGISAADANHIFNDFYRGSDSRQGPKGGFGLGLASARRIALLMDGRAALDPRWIRGSAFYLEFPSVLPQPAQAT